MHDSPIYVIGVYIVMTKTDGGHDCLQKSEIQVRYLVIGALRFLIDLNVVRVADWEIVVNFNRLGERAFNVTVNS